MGRTRMWHFIKWQQSSTFVPYEKCIGFATESTFIFYFLFMYCQIAKLHMTSVLNRRLARHQKPPISELSSLTIPRNPTTTRLKPQWCRDLLIWLIYSCRSCSNERPLQSVISLAFTSIIRIVPIRERLYEKQKTKTYALNSK